MLALWPCVAASSESIAGFELRPLLMVVWADEYMQRQPAAICTLVFLFKLKLPACMPLPWPACLPACLLGPGVQMWVWMAPNHLKAIWKVLVAENAIVKRLFNFEIGFTVTSKEKAEESRWAALKKAFTVTWPHLLYYLAFAAGILYFIVTAALNYYT